MEMCTLLDLPVELQQYILGYLCAKDLVSLSGTCRWLRQVVNEDRVWKRFSDDGVVGEALAKRPSVVTPVFNIPETADLPPLCQHRLHYARQSRLFNNIRRKNFASYDFYSQEIPMNFSEFETSKMPTREVTYKGIYLFALSYQSATALEEEVDVLNIENKPKLITSFPLVKHLVPEDYHILIYHEVVDDYLVVRQDDWFDFFQINLPDLDFPLLFTINVNPTGHMEMGSSAIINNSIFVENDSDQLIEVWNISSKTKIDCIRSKGEGDIRWEAVSKDKNYVLLFSGVNSNSNQAHVFVYNVPKMEIMPFQPSSLPNNIFHEWNIYAGLIDNGYVVILSEIDNVSILVYDLISSALLAEGNDCSLMAKYFKTANIIEDNLICADQFSLKIICLNTLETVREFVMDCGGITTEIPQYFLNDVQCVSISKQCNLILVNTTNGSELWDYNSGKRLYHLPSSLGFFVVKDSYMIVLLNDSSWIKILNFW